MWIGDFGLQIADCGLRIEGELMTKEEMKRRTKEFAKEIIKLCRSLPKNREGRLIGEQIFRSGTSIAANYRAACRARSTAEFISKMGIVEEEADETLFWLEIIQEMDVMKTELLQAIIKENDEIISIVVSSIKTAKQKRQQRQ